MGPLPTLDVPHWAITASSEVRKNFSGFVGIMAALERSANTAKLEAIERILNFLQDAFRTWNISRLKKNRIKYSRTNNFKTQGRVREWSVVANISG